MPMKSELGRLVELQDGAFGTVYAVPQYELRGDEGTALAYKEYKATVSGQGGVTAERAAALKRAVDFRRRDRRGQAELDKYFAWPWETVKDDATGEVCGFLMPLAQQDFFWHEGNPSGKPRTLDWLISPEPNWRAQGVDLSALGVTERLFLMAQLVFAIDLLHKRGWVFGDLSFPNGAFALDPPRLMLFDCDDAADLTDRNRKQPHSPNWLPPECRPGRPPHLQDTQTDVYKLGLAIVRCLNPARGASTTFDVGRLRGILDSTGIDLVTRALLDHGQRPDAEELFEYLWSFTEPRIVPPRIVTAGLATSLVMRGAQARVLWQIEKATEVKLLLGENPPQVVREIPDPANFPDSAPCAVTRSGQLTVRAANPYGSDEHLVGDVALYEIPPFTVDFTQLPRLDIPPIPAFPAEFPVVELPTAGFPSMQKIPSMPNLGLADMLRHFYPDPTLMVPPPHIDDAVLDSSYSVVEHIRTETERYIADTRGKLAAHRARKWKIKNG